MKIVLAQGKLLESNRHKLNFEKLVAALRQAHASMAAQAGRAINISLTLRNWAIGCYIREYEQNGADRAEYGTQVLECFGQELIPGEQFVDRLSFTHFVELIKLEDPLKSAFYEIACIWGNWSVRELKRQIGSFYYERSGLSKGKKELAALAQESAKTTEPRLTIRDPSIFEFLIYRLDSTAFKQGAS